MPHRCLSTLLPRRLIAVFALAAFVAATTGIPVLKLDQPGKTSQPYPCQHHHCGCVSAEQCWQSCCCFTNHEKLLWAGEHNVTPPNYVVAAAQREKPKASFCCAHTVAKSSSAAATRRPATAQGAALGTRAKENPKPQRGEINWSSNPVSRADPDDQAISSPHRAIDFVLAIHARRCQGQAQLWLALGAVALPPPAVTVNLESLLCTEVNPFVATLAGVTSSPATPPPRA